jgi:hypothetical protein
VLQQQDTYCRNANGSYGLVADTRVLGVYLLRTANGQTQLDRLAVDSLPGGSDLGVFGWSHPRRPWLYIGSKFSQRIYGFQVDPATGSAAALPGSPFDAAVVNAAADAGLPTMIMDPTGKYLYMSRFPSSQPPHAIHAFSIDQSTGALTAVASYSLP